MNPAENNRGEMRLISFGGTGGLVTGSCHIIERGCEKVMTDFGMFQGKNEIYNNRGELRDLDHFSEIIRGVSHVLYTHVHMDHGGRIPYIYDSGFTPTVLTLEPTKVFSRIMWEDSVKIQTRENKRTPQLCTQKGVDLALRHTEIVEPFEEVEIGSRHSKLTAKFIPNGHVMGSASLVINDERLGVSLLFTGDMGKPHQYLGGGYEDLIPRFPSEPINAMFVESTCFEGEPMTSIENNQEMLGFIKETWDRGGVPVIAVLSFHRSHERIETIHNLQESGEIPDDCDVFIDAPLAMKLLGAMKDLGPRYLGNNFGDILDFYKTKEESEARFNLKHLTIIETHEDSIRIAKMLSHYGKKAIVIASGGMGNKGRSINYLGGPFNQNPNNSFIFTCHQVSGTPGAEWLKQPNNPNRAKKYFLRGNTSHISGPEQTFGFLERFNLDDLWTVSIGHGDESSRTAMLRDFRKRGYQNTDVLTPKIGEVIRIQV